MGTSCDLSNTRKPPTKTPSGAHLASAQCTQKLLPGFLRIRTEGRCMAGGLTMSAVGQILVGRRHPHEGTHDPSCCLARKDCVPQYAQSVSCSPTLFEECRGIGTIQGAVRRCRRRELLGRAWCRRALMWRSTLSSVGSSPPLYEQRVPNKRNRLCIIGVIYGFV